MTQRACFLEAQLEGFSSSQFEMGSIPLSAYQGSGVLNIPNLVLAPKDSGDLEVVLLPAENSVPGKASKAWKDMLKSLRAGNEKEAAVQLQEAVQAAPKFPEGWNLLGALYERDHQLDKAREAEQHAIEQNPKLLGPELRLARVCDELGDFQASAKAADTVIKADPRFYPEIYLHQAIARMGLKDLDGAKTSIETEMKLDPGHKYVRAEYVLGRILQAQGDVKGAQEHIGKYLEQDPAPWTRGRSRFCWIMWASPTLRSWKPRWSGRIENPLPLVAARFEGRSRISNPYANFRSMLVEVVDADEAEAAAGFDHRQHGDLRRAVLHELERVVNQRVG